MPIPHLKKKTGLSEREAHFAREYIIDKRPSRAALAAGYKNGPGLAAQAGRLLTKEKVKAIIDEGLARQLEEADLEAADVVRELKKLGFSNMGDYASFGPDGVELNDSEDLTRDQLAAVSEVTETKTETGGSIRFKLHDKHAALVTLGRHFDMFNGAKPANEGDGLVSASTARPRVEARLVAIGERVTLERIVTERVIVERSERRDRET